MMRRSLSGIALALSVALTTSACVVSAPEAPGDAVTSFPQPMPGSGTVVPADTPLPTEVSMCPGTLSPSSLPPAGQMAPGTTMAEIFDRGRLVVGIDIGSNLLSFRDPITGEIKGFDADIAHQIAAAIFGDPNRVHFRILSTAERQQALIDGTVDVVVKTMSATCDRAKQVDFSATYFIAQQRILAPRGAPINTVGDLSGRRVCEVRGTTSLDRVRRLVPSATVIAADSWSDCLVMLQQQQVDAVSTDDAILAGLEDQDPNLTVTGPSMGLEYYAVGIGKNRPDLVRFINGVLLRMAFDGTWMRLYNQWFAPTLGQVWSAPAAQYTG
ncbi:Extracellular solute-binding protein family 3 OS=Tsukamurella paurometabola (strain ATCC 8368 / DSM / CCUG 35730 / CIP 100753 / JCM 10117 / KCTC 9821 /NBRC 16120 / NCIMB 702349 / NCTC 13040) OX=521096 GN=Tpau_3754 PE=3 SV=1 [Tsukamurella paurometabola]|uniref:Extracellular solute-binding protein family 3 n=1 Tax=Tsukamurella paurometabola (strain ATCC 8368 / DSM 20162 / CCUG 35730 / CIP 100753 / JCM 10117 / KCTC 9821 / NBRC 16120 / NCIMB 702349 / NCTC 13040) TaxID=521096 RepID=D5UYM9_TSUPD|nr:glutamate ABC transporter substrate-binding protein [Tsukamurella paurometabola]ADG80332.1 extracellular solute-binding protein family 3 [Tsukamurella paurometabola DSM 20162]SUP39274.1 ABC transporter arginine-binding protein 1 precursor [Tsukamurella paurometabola]